MAAPKTHEERVSEILAERLQREPSTMSTYLAPAMGAVKVRAQKERELFWRRNPDEDEAALWEEIGQVAMEQQIPPEEALRIAKNHVAARLYPGRLDVVRAGERSENYEKQARFVKRMIKLGPPDGMAPPPVAAPPPMADAPMPEMPMDMPMDEPMLMDEPDFDDDMMPMEGGLSDAPAAR